MPKPATTVIETFSNGDERCEARWPAGAERVESPVADWRQVRNVDLSIDAVTGETVLSFIRKNAARRST